jgi:hypothetical protein
MEIQREGPMTRTIAVALIAGLVAACTPEPPQTRSPSSPAVRSLDPHERNRLNSAVTRAFGAPDRVAVAYTIEPLDIEAEPTVVSATPVGPAADRADGGSCRPLEIMIIKEGRTSKSTVTFCRAAGSKAIAPSS